MTNSNAFAAAISEETDTLAAVRSVADQALNQLGVEPNLAVVFFSASHIAQADEAIEHLAERLNGAALLGCGAESIAGNDREVELESAVTLWLASLPDSTITPARLEFARTNDGGSVVGWPDSLIGDWPEGATLLALGDPFSFPMDFFLEQLNSERPNFPVIGGMASSAQQPGGNRLVMGNRSYTDGAVGVWIHGGVRIRSVVSQGCRPIGEPFVVTKAEQNVIQELGGLPAYQRLEEVYSTLATSEQRMMQQGLHVGRVVSEYLETFGQGDFLIRNVIGVDHDAGEIAVGDFIRVGQTVQFHIRDAGTADAELKQLLAAASQEGSAEAALLFTCNGRGTRLFKEPHHDVAAIASACGSVPISGFFAAGEVGPIGGQNFLHGFTASIALFQPI